MECSLRILALRGGALGPNMAINTPELVTWLTEYAFGDSMTHVERRDVGRPTQKALEGLLQKIQSPDLGQRMLIMLALEPGYEESTLTTRATAAGQIGGLRGNPNGVSGKHYRERLFEIDGRKAADEIVAAMNEEHRAEMRRLAERGLPVSVPRTTRAAHR
jgi:hypothetical protein